MNNEQLTIILGNQLFDYKYYKNIKGTFFMAEDYGLCTHYKYHKHKIIHFLTSMREYADLLRNKKRDVVYCQLNKKTNYLKELEKVIKRNKVKKITIYEVEDKFFEKHLLTFIKKQNLDLNYLETPNFMHSREKFKKYLSTGKKPFLNSFYIQMRKEHEILLDSKGKPLGGKWSLDAENRKKMPQEVIPPPIKPMKNMSPHLDNIKDITEKYFKDHPGEVDLFWIPTNRKDAIKWYKDFLKKRFNHFGDYQDALALQSPFLYHSAMASLMNIGFLNPDEVIREALQFKDKVPLNSLEGFIRQILGWREFVRGIYQNFHEQQWGKNYFKHKRKLTEHWYNATTGIPPLDDAIKKANQWGYCHHIERLMVVGNLMLLLEIHPREVFSWFMEMFVDSSDWVMGPNVFGMSQFSDGGIFATKPYIGGSNYILKMSSYKKGDWCDAWDGLYWQFIDKKREMLKSNPRLSMNLKTLEKMDLERKKRIYKAADRLKRKITTS